MRKITKWLSDKILYLCTLFLLLFIPLYPKLPLLDIRNTWVYVRVEDFIVVFVLAIWLFLFFRRKITLKTPLTIPILVFWIIGIIATLHGIILIFPLSANVFSNVAFFTFLRHIEYMSLFFVAYSAMKDKKLLPGVIAILSVTFILVSLYGIGQKYLSFPAYLTMNEEFAKGLPITLSNLSRVPSTFAGHYDLAAYLVLIIPILASLIFGVRNWLMKIFFIFSVLLGVVMLAMTVSRVSFFALLIALIAVLYFRSKKLVAIVIPFAIFIGIIFLSTQPALFSRFGDTVKVVNVLVDSKTGNAVGHVDYVSSKSYENRILNQRKMGEGGQFFTDSIRNDQATIATVSSSQVLKILPPEVPYVSDVNLSTGENLPQGTGYINLSLSPVDKNVKYFFYEKKTKSGENSSVFVFHGDFLIKKASAYDLSFTTRFQGEWPHAFQAFARNILVGSGYGSVSLAVDNNFLRILGETGLLGFISFFGIFVIIGIYIRKTLPHINSNLTKSFILGTVAGFIGLLLNAVFIDVFEASKIAFVLWMLAGIVMGILVHYQKDKMNIVNELKKIALSPVAVAVYILTFVGIILAPMINNFFVGDDFTWFRWVTDCSLVGNIGSCLSPNTVIEYFADSNGFFYRPGTKTYFLLMYSIFWLNQVVYHAVSILLHFTVAVLFFVLAKKILQSFKLSALATFLFVIMSGYVEVIYWTSATGHLFNAVLILLSFQFFILWEKDKKFIFLLLSLLASFLSALFHELGVVVPLLLISYKIIFNGKLSLNKLTKSFHYLILFIPTAVYLLMRLSVNSHWFNGDYSYSLVKLPLNLAGNIIGYFMLIISGPISLPIYQSIRIAMRENIFLSLVLTVMCLIIFYILGRGVLRRMNASEKKIILFGFVFFIITLIPFLGLGNITSRYSYLASLGVVMIIVVFLSKLFYYLKDYGREVAYLLMVIIIGVFSIWHIIQIQQANSDWRGAGIKAQKFFVSIEDLYEDTWSYEPIELHLVDVPIRYGDAWVFPVGLEDAVWLAFRNRDIKVFRHSTVDEAFEKGAGTTLLNPVFIFNDDGSLKQIVRPKNILR